MSRVARVAGSVAAGCNVYAQVAKPGMFENGGGRDSSFHGYTVTFPGPTDATNVMLRAIRKQAGPHGR